MDIGDIASLLFFGFLILSFFGGAIGRRKSGEKRPARPTDLSERGGRTQTHPERPAPQPMVTHTPEGPVIVNVPPPNQEARERLEDKLGPRHIEKAQQRAQERYGTSGLPESYADRQRQRRRPSPASEVHRRRGIVEGGDVLRRSLKDPATLERGFIVKEVLDLPVGLRRDA